WRARRRSGRSRRASLMAGHHDFRNMVFAFAGGVLEAALANADQGRDLDAVEIARPLELDAGALRHALDVRSPLLGVIAGRLAVLDVRPESVEEMRAGELFRLGDGEGEEQIPSLRLAIAA